MSFQFQIIYHSAGIIIIITIIFIKIFTTKVGLLFLFVALDIEKCHMKPFVI